MKFMKITILCICFFFIIPLSAEGKKSVENNHFLNANPNIKHEELKSVLDGIKQDFEFERGIKGKTKKKRLVFELMKVMFNVKRYTFEGFFKKTF